MNANETVRLTRGKMGSSSFQVGETLWRNVNGKWYPAMADEEGELFRYRRVNGKDEYLAVK